MTPNSHQPKDNAISREAMDIVDALEEVYNSTEDDPYNLCGNDGKPLWGSDAHQSTITLNDSRFSQKALFLFNMALKHSGLGRNTQTLFDADGDATHITIKLHQDLQPHALKEAIRDCIKILGEGWEKINDDYIKKFPADNKQNKKNIRENRIAQFLVLEAAISGLTYDFDLRGVEEIYIDQNNREIPEKKFTPDMLLKHTGLRISSGRAHILNQVLGLSIGIER